VLGGLKTEGKDPISKAGYAGLIKYQQAISFAIGGVAICLYGFLEVRRACVLSIRVATSPPARL
jgi:hypothetical protein